MEPSGTDQAMEVTVRVMSDGQEIDRITCSPRLNEGIPTVKYRQQSWRVVGGCIHIDEEPAGHEKSEPAWTSLVQNLLPPALPDQVDACSKLLQTCFRESLPQGVIQAAASLTALRLEQQARTLLVDFFKEHRDAHRLYRLLQMQLLFWERSERAKEVDSIAVPPVAEHHAETPLQEADLDWEWAPSSEEPEAPDVDDRSLRTVAAGTQESIGAYRAKELGSKIPEFEELTDGEAWLQVSPTLASSMNHNESVLLERTAKLGQTALDLLRYFSDNPGDKAVHAEAVLGYPISDINRLLLGSLGHYMRRGGSGGWECHPWVAEVLSALDEARNEN